MKIPCMKKPCSNCPFKKDALKGWLGKRRITEILENESFVCHKDITKQCAGHMLLKGDENGFVKIAKHLGHDLKLTGRDEVFDTKEDCIKHHTGNTRK